MIKSKIVLAVILFAATAAQAAEVLIPRSIGGDQGRYFLLSKTTQGIVVKTLHKRVGPDSVGFTIVETNCATMKQRTMGYGEDSPKNIEMMPTKWYDLVRHSSKSDLALFVCKR